MRQTELIMGMPITVEIIDENSKSHFKQIFDYFKTVDKRYSTYKKNSEISKINNGLDKSQWSSEMKAVLEMCDQTKQDSNGYFNVVHKGKIDPSGLVKGWAIYNAAVELIKHQIRDFYIEAGGDIQVHGKGSNGQPWKVGIRNPFKLDQIIKTLKLSTEGVATSGTYIRGQHIYNPFNPNSKLKSVKSLTVVGPNIYEADRYATAAFAMGKKGIEFIESKAGLEGYMVDKDMIATYTSGFERYVFND
jgi:thiamine biosynthesis lipoprotein